MTYIVIHSPKNKKPTIAFFENRDAAIKKYIEHPANSQFFMVTSGCVEKLFPEEGTLLDVPFGIEIDITPEN